MAPQAQVVVVEVVIPTMTYQLTCLVLIVGSYLLGSASSAILVTWLWIRKDIRTLGNRNAGVANVARCVGLAPAMLVGVVDFAKGALPVLAARWIGLVDVCALAAAVAAVFGHSYPLYFRFRGGKGLAVSLGALLVFTPFATFLVLPVLGFVYLVVTGSAVTGALVSLGLLTGINAWQGRPLEITLAPLVLLVTMGLCTIPQILFDWRQRADKGSLLVYWFSPKDMSSQQPVRVAVITDSVASLPPDLCAREQIHIIPLSLIMPEGVYRDGIDIDPRRYYRLLREEQLSPKTSAPSPGEFLGLYNQLARTHTSGVVITPPKELTQTWESARLAGEMSADHFTVQVVDSRAAGPAEGFVALAAARLARQGVDLENILHSLEAVQKNVGFIGVLDTLKFLEEGGRVVEAHQWVKSALRLFPVLCLTDGQIRPVGMARTRHKAIERMTNWLKSNLPGELAALAVCHTDALEEATTLGEMLKAIFHPHEFFISELTPVIGAHTGPGLIGVAWWGNGE